MSPSPPPVPRKSIYEGTTQYKNWRYSINDLAKIRAALNYAAVSAIRKKFEADEPGSSVNVSFLTSDEEILLVKLYLTKITALCGHFHFPEEVEATAISYTKRFYLKNTVMDWHPKSVMLTALFLATKTTNNPISLEHYASRIPKTEPSDVLELEFLVAQSIGFEFSVWHAHRALWGIVLDCQNLEDIPSQSAMYDAASVHVRASRLTDVEFIYTPSQIAFTAFWMSSPDVAMKWAHFKFPTDTSPIDALMKATETIKTLIELGSGPSNVEAVREVDKRLRICKNPEKVVGSKAYLAKKAEDERKAEIKRTKKADDVQKAMQDGDPFGNPMAANVDDDDDDDE